MPAAAHLRLASDDKREPLKVDFSKRLLETIGAPKSGRTWVYDNKLPGLALMITDSGARSFYLYKWVNSRPRRIRLGAFDGITVDQARTLCAKELGRIA